MKISYGLVFYFSIALGIATLALLFLFLRPLRHLVMGIVKKYRIGEGQLYAFSFWILLALIIAILGDAVWSYLVLKETL